LCPVFSLLVSGPVQSPANPRAAVHARHGTRDTLPPRPRGKANQFELTIMTCFRQQLANLLPVAHGPNSHKGGQEGKMGLGNRRNHSPRLESLRLSKIAI
jgi:hypothetical protein